MRRHRGHLISVWVPGNHGAGGSTVTASLGIGLQYLYDIKIMMINLSNKYSYMEKFLENDINMSYSIDNLRGFGENIELNHIEIFSTHINESLSIIPGTKLKKDNNSANTDFELNLIDKCLETYDLVIVDIESGTKNANKKILDKCDLLLSIMTSNEIMLDNFLNDISTCKTLEYILDTKTSVVFNHMNSSIDMDKELLRFNKKYGIRDSFGTVYDKRVFEESCKKRKLYSFLIKGFEAKNNLFVKNLEVLCNGIGEKLDIKMKKTETYKFTEKIRKIKQVFGFE